MMTTKCVNVVTLWSSWPNCKLARPLTEVPGSIPGRSRDFHLELACFGDGDNLGNSNGPRMCLGGGGSKCHKSKFVCVVDLPDREYIPLLILYKIILQDYYFSFLLCLL